MSEMPGSGAGQRVGKSVTTRSETRGSNRTLSRFKIANDVATFAIRCEASTDCSTCQSPASS